MADGAGRCGGRCMLERTGGRALTTRSSGRGRKGCGQWSGGVDRAHEARTRERAEEVRTGPRRRGRADGRTGRSGPALRGRRVGWTGGRADERVGLGLKGHIPRGPLHSWAPILLASSERERVGCLGVQWGPPLFHVKHPYLVPGLTCLV